MEPLIFSLVPSSESAIVWLFRWSWQALLLLASMWLVVKCYRSQTPALRHYIWLCGLIAVAVLPFWDAVAVRFPLAQPAGGAFASVMDMPAAVIARLTVSAVESGPAATQTAAPGQPFSIWLALCGVWICGVLFALARLGRDHLSLRRARRRGRRTSLVELGCAGLDGSSSAKAASIVLSSEVLSPVLAGVLRPTILLPADMLTWTNLEERRAILQHELAHLARRDHQVNLLQTWLRILFFFHPLVRYACHQLYVERELACDDQVLSSGTRPSVYAESILKAAERGLIPASAHSLGFFGSKENLERRIEMIMNQRRVRGEARPWRLIILPILMIVVMILLLGAVRPAEAGKQQDQNKKASRQSSDQDRSILPPPPPPPPPQPPATMPLPEEVTGLSLVALLESNQVPVPFAVESQPGATKDSYKNIVVRVPEFTFKGEKGYGRGDWVYLVDSFEMEHDRKTYYGSGSIFLRRMPQTLNASSVLLRASGDLWFLRSRRVPAGIEFWFSSHGGIYDNPSRTGTPINLADLVPDAGPPPPPPPPPPKPIRRLPG